MTKLSRGPTKVFWDNPPEGLTLQFPGGAEMHVGPKGLLTVLETAFVLDRTPERVYQMIASKKLRVRGSGVRRVPVSEVRRLVFPKGESGRFFVN